jgi:hypothetical protein
MVAAGYVPWMNKKQFLPTEPRSYGSATPQLISRAIFALAVGKLTGEDPENVIEYTWGVRDEKLSPLVVRATSVPLSTAASSLVTSSHTALLVEISQASAAAKLFSRCVRLDFDGVNQVVVPVTTSSDPPLFTSEASPGVMVQNVLGGVTFGPTTKLLFGFICTAELEKYTIATATAIIGRALAEKAGLVLDNAVFDSAAASAGVRSAGLLNGVSDIGTPFAGGGQPACAKDLGRLAGAIGAAGISVDDVVFVMNPTQAVAARILAPALADNIFATAAVPAGTVVAVSPSCIASGYSGVPEIEIVTDGAVVLDDATPMEIATAGGVIGTPVRSLFQANLIGVKVRIQCCWGSLVSGAVQKIASVTW